MSVPDVNSALAGLVQTAGFDPAALRQCQPHRQRAGAAVLFRNRHWRASHDCRGRDCRQRTMADAHRTPTTDRRRYAPCGDRVPQRTLSATRWQTLRGIPRRSRRPLSLRRRTLGTPAHQPAPSLQRSARAAELPARQKGRAARGRRMASRSPRDRGGRSWACGHRLPVFRRVGQSPARPRGCRTSGLHHRADRRRAAEPACPRRTGR